MRKGLFVLATLLVFGLVAMGCSVRVGYRAAGEDSGVEINETASIEGINEIEVNIPVGEVEIKETEGRDIKINGYYYGSSEDFKIDNENGKLVIGNKEILNIGFDSFSLDFRDYSQKKGLVIEIPSSYNKDFAFNQGTGVGSISGINVNKLTINGGVGETEIDDIVFKNADVKLGVGNTEISLIKECGNITVNGGVGDFKMYMKEVGGNLKYKGGVGSAKIDLPRNAPVKINKSVGIGDCKIKEELSADYKYIFDMECGIGDVKIE